MWRVIATPFFAVLLGGLATVGWPQIADAAEQDGAWSVLVINAPDTTNPCHRHGFLQVAALASYAPLNALVWTPVMERHAEVSLGFAAKAG
jgi:hypothetical protein